MIENERLQENSMNIGAKLDAGMKALMAKHSLIGEAPGKGLMNGVELVKDRTTREPASAQCGAVFGKYKEKGLLIGKGGPWGNTLRIMRPMCIHDAEVWKYFPTMGTRHHHPSRASPGGRRRGRCTGQTRRLPLLPRARSLRMS